MGRRYCDSQVGSSLRFKLKVMSGETVTLKMVFKVLGCLLILGVVCTMPWFCITANHSAHLRLMEDIPVGTSLSDLKSTLGKRAVDWIDVHLWIPAERRDPRNYGRIDGSTIRNKHGIFRRKVISKQIDSSGIEESPFTGQILVYLDRSFADHALVIFTLVRGRVVEKDWGYLPG
jgi:hypothetical protein